MNRLMRLSSVRGELYILKKKDENNEAQNDPHQSIIYYLLRY